MQMPKKFDPDKDECLAEVGRVETTKGEIVCRVMSYDGNDPKVQLNRTYRNKDGEERFANLGRLTGEEIPGVANLLEEARVWLVENEDAPEAAAG
jgi:hypothetical protein